MTAKGDWNALALCAGFGMLEEGVGLGLEWLGRNGWIVPAPAFRPVCYVEREITAAARLVARMAAAGTHPPAPVWDDVGTFDGRPWRGKVHCLTAGYPCQPFSQAGLRKGKRDERHLWPDIARVIDECRPVEVVLENVAGHLSLGFQEVGTRLQDMGYRVKAGLFSAAETGARHERKRLVVLARRYGWWSELADTQRTGLAPGEHDCQPGQKRPDGGQRTTTPEPRCIFLADTQSSERIEAELREADEGLHRHAGTRLADATDARHRDWQSGTSRRRTRRRWMPQPDGRGLGLELADAQRVDRRCGESGVEGEAGIGRGEPEGLLSGLADAPGGGVQDARRRPVRGEGPGSPGSGLADTQGLLRGGVVGGTQDGLLRSLEDGPEAGSGDGLHLPLFAPGPSEYAAWIAVLEQAPDLEPALCRDADGLADRVDRLHGLGNGVVPLQIAYAYCTLHLAFVEECRRWVA